MSEKKEEQFVNLGTYFCPTKRPIDLINIKVVNTERECDMAVYKIREQIEDYRIIGLDSEWSIEEKHRCPVCLLQLSTTNGSCFLIRLSKMNIPSSLSYLLGDTSILKVGYGINIDAKNLREDYGLVVRCFVDLVYIGDYVVGERGLKKISAASVGIVYGKSMTCSNWKANRLSFTQQIYAALDAFLPVKILEYCIEKIAKKDSELDLRTKEDKYDYMLNYCKHYMMHDSTSKAPDDFKVKRSDNKMIYDKNNPNNLYNMFGPGDEHIGVCTNNMKKKYVKCQMAFEKEKEPYKLYFFKLTSEVLSLKDKWSEYDDANKNGCVICLDSNNKLIRRRLIPTSYTKHLPSEINARLRRNTVLMCLYCESQFTEKLDKLRLYLAVLCSAPIQGTGYEYLTKHGERLQMLARSLFNSDLDEETKENRKAIIQMYYKESLTDSNLRDIANMTKFSCFATHGEIVTDYFMKKGNIDKLYLLFTDNFMELNPKNFSLENQKCTSD